MYIKQYLLENTRKLVLEVKLQVNVQWARHCVSNQGEFVS